MFKKQVVLAIGLALAVGASARADGITTGVTLGATYSPTSATVPNVVNVAGGEGGGLSYTVTTNGSLGSPIYATGAMDVGTFSLHNGASAGFANATIVETYALEGKQITPVPGAAFTAQFTNGVVAFYAVPTLSFNKDSVATWGTGQAGGTAGVLLYSGTLAPVQNVFQGPAGDPGFGGQPVAGQNQNSFFAASGAQALGADIVNNLFVNSKDFLGAPLNFTGLQGEIQEVNALSPGGAYPGDTNANLDANFTFLAGLAPSQGLTTGQFTALNYTGNVGANGPDTLQAIGITNYPIFASTTPPGVPEPASLLLWAGVAVGFGIYRRTRVKKA